uniref:serum paraoxonase/arylesterase 2-like n=1 Tax=Myxine glutinosa TaxID=7769 RepID=UPI00358E7F6D
MCSSFGLKSQIIPDLSGGKPGKMYFLDLNDDDAVPVPFDFSADFNSMNFNPHGISHFMDHSDGAEKILLFVVNHPNHDSQVDIFHVNLESKLLIYQKTVQHDLLPHINNIVAVGIDAFYATNNHISEEETTFLLSFVMPMNDANVIFYNDNKAVVVAHGLGMANGINLSPDGRHVYVADSTNKEVKVMNRKEDNSLSLQKVIKLHVLPDNIEVDRKTGSLWIGCLPSLWPLVFYGTKHSPGSEVVRIDCPSSAEPSVTTIYSNNGSELQSSSVAARHESHLLIGTVFHRMMRCTLPIIPLEC